MSIGQAADARLSVRGRPSLLREVDLVTVGATAALIIIGLLSIFTATVDPEQGTLLGFQATSALFNKQLVFLVLAAVTLIVAMAVDYRYLKVYAMIAYFVTMFLLLVVMTPIGHSALGSQRWISLGLFKLQPAELAKPVLVAALAAYMAERRGFLRLRDVIRCSIITAPLALLVYVQPDFGTMLVLLWILLTMLVIGGADWRHLVILMVIGFVGVFGVFRLGVVHSYQSKRLQAFFDPAKDPYQEGYNYRLTRTAVGNGGLTGKGIFSK